MSYNLTPLSPLPIVGFTLTLPDAVTVVDADPGPYSNTKEILLLNGSASRIFVQMRVLEGIPLVLPAAGTITAANSTIIPANGSLSLCIGPEGCRNQIASLAFWLEPNPGSRIALVFLAESGVNLELNVTYIQNAGGGGSV